MDSLVQCGCCEGFTSQWRMKAYQKRYEEPPRLRLDAGDFRLISKITRPGPA